MAKVAKHKPVTIIRLSESPKMPLARQFLAHYFAMERPHTTHLFFSKGAIDFLLGLVIGILAGILISLMAAKPA